MTVDDITGDLLPSVNVAQVASALEVMQTVDAGTLPMVAQALRQLSTAIANIQTVLKKLESPEWLPQLRLGYPESNPPFMVDDTGYLRIQGNADIAGTVSASAFRLKQLNVLDMVLSNNSPGAGEIAWSACQVVYDGVVTNISSGDSDKLFVYWDTGDSTFTGADSFDPQIGRFLIATNDNGTADESWNKTGAKSIQRSNLMFSLLEGFQPVGFESGEIDTSTASDSATIVDTTGTPGAGLLLAFSIHAVAGNTTNGELILRIQIDGATYMDVEIQNGLEFSYFTQTIRSDGFGDGKTTGDWFSAQIPISYRTSLKVTLVWARNTGAGTGIFRAVVWRAEKVG